MHLDFWLVRNHHFGDHQDETKGTYQRNAQPSLTVVRPWLLEFPGFFGWRFCWVSWMEWRGLVWIAGDGAFWFGFGVCCCCCCCCCSDYCSSSCSSSPSSSCARAHARACARAGGGNLRWVALPDVFAAEDKSSRRDLWWFMCLEGPTHRTMKRDGTHDWFFKRVHSMDSFDGYLLNWCWIQLWSIGDVFCLSTISTHPNQFGRCASKIFQADLSFDVRSPSETTTTNRWLHSTFMAPLLRWSALHLWHHFTQHCE